MILSLFIYTGTAFILWLLANNYSKKIDVVGNSTCIFFHWEIVFSILLFAFVAGARYNTGVDHLSYLREYEFLVDVGRFKRESFELGFQEIMKFFANFKFHYFFYFAFLGGLQFALMFYAFRNQHQILPYVVLFILLGPYFLLWMNGIRQCIVTIMLLYIVRYIEEKNFCYYVIGIVLASLIHKSVLILLPLYLLGFITNEWRHFKVLILIVLVCVLIGETPIWVNVLTEFGTLTQTLGYEADLGEQLKVMRETAWGPGRTSLFLVNIIIIWYYPKIRTEFSGQSLLNIYFMFFYIGVCAYNLLINTTHIFLRPVEYFTIFNIPLLGYTLLYLRRQKSLFFYVLCILAFSNAYISILKAVSTPSKVNETSLYHFFFPL